MNVRPIVVAFVSSVLICSSHSARAEAEAECISSFNEAAKYNWLALKNDCDDTAVVVFGFMSQSYAAGQMTLAPGQSGNTGRSASEIAQQGGIHWVACPVGKRPYSAATARDWGGNSGNYNCK